MRILLRELVITGLMDLVVSTLPVAGAAGVAHAVAFVLAVLPEEDKDEDDEGGEGEEEEYKDETPEEEEKEDEEKDPCRSLPFLCGEDGCVASFAREREAAGSLLPLPAVVVKLPCE